MLSVYRPTSSQISTQSKLPILKSNSELSFFIHILFWSKRKDLWQCIIISTELCSIVTNCFAKLIAFKLLCKINRNTSSVLNWFKNLDEKENRKFIKFDIAEFYPWITEELLMKASNHFTIIHRLINYFNILSPNFPRCAKGLLTTVFTSMGKIEFWSTIL